MNCLNKAVGPEEAAARADAGLFFLCLKEKDPETIRSRLKALSETVNAFNLDAEHPLLSHPSARGLHCGRSCAGGHGDPGPGQDRLPQSNG